MNFEGKSFALHQGDCIEHMATLPECSIDLAVFSPPFPAVYAYTDLGNDLGNSEGKAEMRCHFSFFYRQLARVLKPGRVAVVHVTQIPRKKRDGEIGMFDFRGWNIRLGERAGLVFEYDWLIRKNPQAQAIRTRSRELQFAGLESDRANSRGTLCDYLLKFRAPGENKVPVDGAGEVTRNQWISYAEGCWLDIKETDTLNTKAAKSDNDTRHVCPLQLGVIDRVVRLFSNPGEIVFSPFAGIGSEGYVAVKLGRRFYGCELKPEYYAEAMRNLEKASQEVVTEAPSLFSMAEADDPVVASLNGD